jgi:hypothetical protein
MRGRDFAGKLLLSDTGKRRITRITRRAANRAYETIILLADTGAFDAKNAFGSQ